ncbi:MAG: hypothetical protein JNJ59_03320 [Deltaproteobacteria bacterium]|nr:hypothetical protein [Deltaproteobacteria bacterium]
MRPHTRIALPSPIVALGVLGIALAWTACHDDLAGPACAPDQCAIDGACYDHLAPNPANPCEACIALDLGSRRAWSPRDGASCDDGASCTAEDQCRSGSCVGTPVRCDDGDPCTRDRCDEANGCVAEPDPVACGKDPCAATPPPDCDDDDPCTDDRCEPGRGCAYVPVDDALALACDDEDACTRDDRCVAGVCEGIATVACDDGDLCTVDVCDPAVGCRHGTLASLCDDDNPCTDERCDPAKGCVYPFNTASCDDGSVCTVGDTCRLGACLGTPVAIDDLNPCTDDACDAVLGVVHVDNQRACSDVNACTVGDRCAAGRCVPGAEALACDDGNGCTDDRCDPLLGCVFAPHERACSDGSLCTANDKCSDGDCLGEAVDCDDDNACTTDACVPTVGCTHTVVVSNACRPNIVVTNPLRGATLTAGNPATLSVSGTVTSGGGPITSLKVNGTTTAVAANGGFTRSITPKTGGNILVIEATDALGTARTVVQSFLWSRGYRHPTTPKNGIVPQGIGVWLDKVAIDDGTRASPPNDLASILQIALRAFDIAALIPSPAASNVDAGGLVGTYNIYVQNLTYSPPTATLTAQSGGIHLRGTIPNGRANIRANKTCSAGLFSCWGPTPITGTMTFSSIVIDADLDLSVSNNDIRVVVRQSSVAINNVQISIDGAFGWLAEFILGFFKDDLVARVASEFNAQIAPVIGPLVRDGLRELAFSVALDIPKLQGGGSIPVELKTDWSDVTCTSAGCKIVLRAGAWTDVKRTPYTNSGVPNRDACGSGTQTLVVPGARPLELSLADDTLNELLFAVWRGGLLELPVPAAWLAGVDLSTYGISDLTMTLSGMLAPTAGDCGGQGLEAHVGDLQILAKLKLFGQPVDVVIWASAVAGLQLVLDGNEIAIRVTAVKRVETQVTVQQSDLIALEPVIADLIRDQVVDALIGQIAGTDLGSFPLPQIDLSGAIAGLPPGTGIAIQPETLTRNQGNTIAAGRLK